MIVRTELVKSLRRTRTYVAFGILILIPMIMAVAIELNPPDAGGQGRLLYLASQTGLILPAFALRITSAFLLVIVVALFGGDAIAGEASWGNLRYLLMRPIGRGRLIAAKFAVAVFCAWLAVVLVVVTGLIVGIVFFGADPVQLSFGPFSFSQSTGDILGHLAVATVYVAWSLTGVVAFSFMVSCMTDAPFGAIFAGVGLYFTSLILDSITSLGSLRYALPTHYFDTWVDLVTHGEWHSDLWRGVAAAVRVRDRLRVDRALVVQAQRHPQLTWRTGRRSRRCRRLRARSCWPSRRSPRPAPRTARRELPSARSRRGCVRCWCSRAFEDPPEKIMWGDRHWSIVPGGRAWVEVAPDAVYLAMSLRNVGAGMAVIHGWHADPLVEFGRQGHTDPAEFRPQTRDLYVPPGDSSFWQGAFREGDERAREEFAAAIGRREILTVELLYGDHEGGQRTISRYALGAP